MENTASVGASRRKKAILVLVVLLLHQSISNLHEWMDGWKGGRMNKNADPNEVCRALFGRRGPVLACS